MPGGLALKPTIITSLLRPAARKAATAPSVLKAAVEKMPARSGLDSSVAETIWSAFCTELLENCCCR
jgi:hypothetical protein